MADQITGRLLNKQLGRGIALTLYPVASGAPAPGVTLTDGGGNWGAYANIIAAGLITRDFWLTQIQYDTIVGVQVFEIDIYNATLPARLYQDRINPTAVTPNLGPTTLPYPVYCAPSTQVQGRAGGTGGKTINVSLLVATGL